MPPTPNAKAQQPRQPHELCGPGKPPTAAVDVHSALLGAPITRHLPKATNTSPRLLKQDFLGCLFTQRPALRESEMTNIGTQATKPSPPTITHHQALRIPINCPSDFVILRRARSPQKSAYSEPNPIIQTIEQIIANWSIESSLLWCNRKSGTRTPSPNAQARQTRQPHEPCGPGKPPTAAAVGCSALLTLHTAGAARQPQGTGHRLSMQFHKPSGAVLKEVGAPACRILVASSANALTPWLKDLDASTWAKDPNTRRQALS